MISQDILSWLECVLFERYGHNFTLRHCVDGLALTLNGSASGKIVFSSNIKFFISSHLEISHTSWDCAAEGWVTVLSSPLPAPGATHLPQPLITVDGEQAGINYDILGLTYWMLNRIEEIDRTDLDNHARFPATASHAFKHNYLERPVVDEWLYILGQVIVRVWPQIELKKHSFSMKVSHDVDSPSLYAFKPWKTIARMMAGHIIKRRNIKAFLTAPYVKVATKNKLHSSDPYNTFDWLMDVSEDNNLTSAFYFICGRTSSMDAEYEPEDPIVQELMRSIHNRGHEIGLHPSYNTYQAPELIKQEADRLRNACAKAGVRQSEYGGRMHYLRWQQPVTLQAWEDAGMAYDTTLGYADRPGFRCGTCFEYPAFNPVTHRRLKLRIRPLIAMDCTVIDDVYLGLGVTDAARNKFIKLKEKCQKVNGSFTLLWHNSYFVDNKKLHNIYQDSVCL